MGPVGEALFSCYVEELLSSWGKWKPLKPGRGVVRIDSPDGAVASSLETVTAGGQGERLGGSQQMS